MSRHLFVREWWRLCQRAGQVWKQGPGPEDLARSTRRSELVERGARYGVNLLREIERRLPAVEATLAATIEGTLWTSVDGSEDWDVIEERVDGIVIGELRRDSGEWTSLGASS